MCIRDRSNARGIAAETLAAEATLDLKALRRMKAELTDKGDKENNEHYSLPPRPTMDEPNVYSTPVYSEWQASATDWSANYEARVMGEGQNVYSTPVYSESQPPTTDWSAEYEARVMGEGQNVYSTPL